MNKEPTLIAVLVVIFIFGIQLLVIESYQTSLFKNNNDDDDNNNNDDDDNNDGKFEAKVCEKLLDSETCKKIEEELKSKTKKLTKEEIQSEQKTKKLTKEEIQAEQIRSRYLEPVDPNQNTINNIEQTNKNTQIGNSEPIQNEIIKSDANPQNPSSPPPSSPSPPSPPINTTDSSSISLSLLNLNTLDQNQLIDALSSKISQIRNFDKNKISQALFDLTKSTAAKGGDVMNSLRQIGTKILQNSSDPLIGKIIGLAQTK
jgi:hypothetical protein